MKINMAAFHEPRRAVFICYSHIDNESPSESERWFDRSLTFVKPLIRQEALKVRSDQ